MKQMLKPSWLTFLFISFSMLLSAQQVHWIDMNEHVGSINESIEKEKPEEAIKLISVLNENDTVYEAMIKTKIQLLIQLEKYEESINICDQHIKENQNNYNYYLLKGLALLRSQRYDECVTAYQEMLVHHPMNYIAYYNMGIAYELNKQFKESILSYQKAIVLNPYYQNPHLRLGNLCYQENKISQALLCWNTYLLINPTSEMALEVLVEMNNAVAQKNTHTPNGIKVSEDDEAFEELDLIITNYAALSKSFKTPSKIGEPLVKQNYALLTKLQDFEGNGGFWSEKYIPLYLGIMQDGQFENFISRIMKATTNEAYLKIINKNTKNQKIFLPWFANEWKLICGKNNGKFWGKEIAQFDYYSEGELHSVGDMDELGNFTGKFSSYSLQGTLKTSGCYEGDKRSGEWKWYYPNGNVEEILGYKNGMGYGPFTNFYEDGTICKKATFDNNLYDGEFKKYSPNGVIEEKSNYKAGNLQGEKIIYYSYGEPCVHFKIPFEQGKIHGTVLEYFPSGELMMEKTFNDGIAQTEKEFYRDGTLNAIYEYDKGVLNGSVKIYYSNGTLKQEGLFKNDERMGLWKTYFINDKLKQEFSYDGKSNLTGSYKEYDIDGNLWYEYQYDENKLVGYTYFDYGGKILGSGKRQGQYLKFKGYFQNGNLISEGMYDENGRKNDMWKYYSIYGALISVEEYDHGVLIKSDIEYNSNGSPNSTIPYLDGLKQGLAQYKFVNNTVNRQGYYWNDTLQRFWYDYYPDGTLKSTLFYVDGEMVGTSNDYDCTGALKNIDYFKKDIVVHSIKYSKNQIAIDTVNYFKDTVVDYYYDNGKIKSRRHYLNGYIHGDIEYYHYNGLPSLKGTYFFGKMHSDWRWYNDSGTLTSQETYEYGVQVGKDLSYHDNGKLSTDNFYSEGKEHGTSVSYNEKGKKTYEGSYVYGERHGPAYYYSDEGELELVRYYRHDELIGYSYPQQDGTLKPMIPIINGTTKIISYSQKGNKAREIEFINGDLDGKYIKYFSNGNMFEYDEYLAGVHIGESKDYYENGQLKSIGHYLNGYQHGEFITYYENGKVHKKQAYLNGCRQGLWEEFKANGTLQKKLEYHDDELIHTDYF
ncbi:MAG: hypothetical protein A2W97_13635 [Bacteroidetes bacterium GWE2_40_63]|nr:MAG: hypothetical protein A2W84_12775 [Bacteroidetes bacterium GWC2_40_13]OFX71266.1 MAG: hypothetical protein A2W96_16270 [Bacteroidetes bacterium GWD2_40_43]OFX89319.1 MAG: hypothetical protein A2W97_13635 [Bacteroidetes bacterium GWE2_40_63]OFY23943.1 MAG: hypothetical protein A2W88_12215 [Bacteroidetes bacterium GWF2_40_13]